MKRKEKERNRKRVSMPAVARAHAERRKARSSSNIHNVLFGAEQEREVHDPGVDGFLTSFSDVVPWRQIIIIICVAP